MAFALERGHLVHAVWVVAACYRSCDDRARFFTHQVTSVDSSTHSDISVLGRRSTGRRVIRDTGPVSTFPGSMAAPQMGDEGDGSGEDGPGRAREICCPSSGDLISLV